MRFPLPWEKCRCCGKNLEEGSGYEILGGDDNFVYVVMHCTNKRCKNRGKRIEAAVPRYARM